MRRKPTSWRVWYSRFIGLVLVAYALTAGHKHAAVNLYDPPISYVLKPALLQSAQPAAVIVPKKSRKPPKRTQNELLCLAQNIFFESGFEPMEGIEAVAAVVFNRTESKYYPRSICAVVYQTKQFSWTADYSKWSRVPPQKYVELAREFIHNRETLQSAYENLTHFHRVDISPRWERQSNMEYRVTYGQHKFYAWMPTQ